MGLFGSADFSNYFLPLSHNVTATNLVDAQKQGPVLAWGSFATYVVNFLIVAVGAVPDVQSHQQPDQPSCAATSPWRRPRSRPTPSREELLLTEIRDLLAQDRI